VDVSKQPLIDSDNNILLWNGEIFGGFQVEPQDSDTSILSKKLQNATNTLQLISVFKTIQGPWAFLYWQVFY
jgi:asparagine synthetase B (glutamine-hydrolysing)